MDTTELNLFIKTEKVWQIAPSFELKMRAITWHSTISQENQQPLLKSHAPDNIFIFQRK